MLFYEAVIANKRPIAKKLLDYGFVNQNGVYRYQTEIRNGEFMLLLTVNAHDETHLTLIDSEMEEEYTLIHNPRAEGEYVSSLREECMAVLRQVVQGCYSAAVHHSVSASLVIGHVRACYGVEVEYPWGGEDSGVFREPNSGKWFGIMMKIDRSKLSSAKEGPVEVMNLKDTPERVQEWIRTPGFYPAYHMNKKHWYTVLLDGTVPAEVLYACIGHSYQLIERKKK